MQPTTINLFVRDYKKIDNNGQYWIGANGNYLNDGTPQADAPDVLDGSSGADPIQGLGGNGIDANTMACAGDAAMLFGSVVNDNPSRYRAVNHVPGLAVNDASNDSSYEIKRAA